MILSGIPDSRSVLTEDVVEYDDLHPTRVVPSRHICVLFLRTLNDAICLDSLFGFLTQQRIASSYCRTGTTLKASKVMGSWKKREEMRGFWVVHGLFFWKTRQWNREGFQFNETWSFRQQICLKRGNSVVKRIVYAYQFSYNELAGNFNTKR